MFWNSDGCIVGGGSAILQCFSSPEIKYNAPCEPVILDVQPQITRSIAFNIYPNPFYDIVKLEVEKPLTDCEIKILSTHMQEIYSKTYDELKMENIDFSDLQEGVYLLQISSQEVREITKILKVNNQN